MSSASCSSGRVSPANLIRLSSHGRSAGAAQTATGLRSREERPRHRDNAHTPRCSRTASPSDDLPPAAGRYAPKRRRPCTRRRRVADTGRHPARAPPAEAPASTRSAFQPPSRARSAGDRPPSDASDSANPSLLGHRKRRKPANCASRSRGTLKTRGFRNFRLNQAICGGH